MVIGRWSRLLTNRWNRASPRPDRPETESGIRSCRATPGNWEAFDFPTAWAPAARSSGDSRTVCAAAIASAVCRDAAPDGYENRSTIGWAGVIPIIVWSVNENAYDVEPTSLPAMETGEPDMPATIPF